MKTYLKRSLYVLLYFAGLVLFGALLYLAVILSDFPAKSM